ncbi:MAG: methyltransferase domain-containing protein [Myxococcota bacterium]
MSADPDRSSRPPRPARSPGPGDLPRPSGDALPVGYYHEVLLRGGPVRRAWHVHKFQRVIDCLPPGPGLSILDVGCSAGSFLSLLDGERFARQVGVDIEPDQIAYAQARFGTPFRRFVHIPSVAELDQAGDGFDCVTLIEVIEHLQPHEVEVLLAKVAELLKPGGLLVITTPNYTSLWPVLELIVSWVSEVAYTEQHVTRFTFFDMMKKLRRLRPAIGDELQLEMKTTSHFLSPFLAAISMRLADRVARWAAPRSWRFPFGNLILMTLRKRS